MLFLIWEVLCEYCWLSSCWSWNFSILFYSWFSIFPGNHDGMSRDASVGWTTGERSRNSLSWGENYLLNWWSANNSDKRKMCLKRTFTSSSFPEGQLDPTIKSRCFPYAFLFQLLHVRQRDVSNIRMLRSQQECTGDMEALGRTFVHLLFVLQINSFIFEVWNL